MVVMSGTSTATDSASRRSVKSADFSQFLVAFPLIPIEPSDERISSNSLWTYRRTPVRTRRIVMKKHIGLLMAGLVLSAQAAMAQPAERKDLQVFNDVAKAVNHYDRFTIFDDISASVKNGVVRLDGKVTMPYKKDDIEKRVAKVDGVTRVVSTVEVLPVSTWDDQLRYRIARAIYGNAQFWNYAASANPPIHIIVERGRVTLTGVVQSDVERMLARSLVNQYGVFSVTNKLQTVAEARDQAEQS
jgi:hyperosmotically inducible periplasmic protein